MRHPVTEKKSKFSTWWCLYSTRLYTLAQNKIINQLWKITYILCAYYNKQQRKRATVCARTFFLITREEFLH